MTDVVDMIRAGVSRNGDKREQIRRDFPGCAAITEQLRAAFGPGVKPLYFSENGKTMGRQQEDFDDDSAKWIWLAMTDAERKQAMRGGR